MKSPDTHVILVRPVATNKWKPLAYAKSAEDAIVSAEKRRKSLRHGDLILAIDLAEVSAIPERGECLYFVDKDGVVRKAANSLYRPTWFTLWEGPEARADVMLRLCSRIDRKMLVTAACAMARTVLQYVKAGEDRPHIAIATAEAWARGEASLEQVLAIHSCLSGHDPGSSAYSDPYVAAYAAAYAAVSIVAAVDVDADDVANYTAIAGRDYLGSLRQLSHIVREYIPLYVVLESRL